MLILSFYGITSGYKALHSISYVAARHTCEDALEGLTEDDAAVGYDKDSGVA